MTNLQNSSHQALPRPASLQPALTLHEQPVPAQRQLPTAEARNPDTFSIAESALLLGAFVTLATSILSFTTL